MISELVRRFMRDEMVITVNDFLQEIGLDPCDDAIGENMGWDILRLLVLLDLIGSHSVLFHFELLLYQRF